MNIKKIISRAAVIALAFVMVFSAWACTAEKSTTENKSKVLSEAIAASAGADNITATLSGSEYDAAQNKSVTVNKKVALKKTSAGYDFSVTDGEDALELLKIGDVIFEPLDPGYYGTSYVKSVELSSKLPSAIESAQNFLSENVEGKVASSNGAYTIAYAESYKEDIEEVIAFIVGGKGVQAGEYLASKMGANYTREMLVDDVNATFADGVKLLAMCNGIDALLAKTGSSLTVKKIVDGACASVGITAQTLKELIPSLKNPKEGESVYDYLLSNGFGVVPADTVLALIGSQIGMAVTTAEIRDMLLSVIDNDQTTFDELYDDLIAPIIGNIAAEILLANSKDSEWLAGELIKGDFFATANLEKLKIEEASYSAAAVIDAKKYTVKSLSVSEKCFVTYSDDIAGEKHVLRIDSSYAVDFDYSAVTVSAPAGKINPCILMSEEEASEAISSTKGGLVISVYEGSGYVFKNLYVYESVLGSEPIEGVTYGDGRVVFDAKAVSAIRASLDNGMYVTLKLNFEDSDKVKFSALLVIYGNA